VSIYICVYKVVNDKFDLESLCGLPTMTLCYDSADSVEQEGYSATYPVEFLNSLDLPGVPSQAPLANWFPRHIIA
jgi:hypothetical protein